MSTGHITSNFTWEEAACHDGTPVPVELQPNARRLANMLERIRADFGGAIIAVSWYRTPAYNARIGGAKASQHCEGHAIDGRTLHMSNLPALIACVERMLAAGKLPELGGMGIYKGWVHLDCRTRGPGGHVARWTGTGVGSES